MSARGDCFWTATMLLGQAVMLAGMLACGGGQPVVSYERIDERKHELQLLWVQIRKWRQEAGLKGLEPPRGEILKMNGEPMTKATNVCPESGQPATQKCTDVCGIADAICENADAICRISDELSGDTWAREKCWSAKASCKEARQECCRCISSEHARQP